MPKTAIIRFNDTIKIAIDLIKHYANDLGNEIVLVRDLYGRIRIILKEKPKNENPNGNSLRKAHGQFAKELEKQLGAFGYSKDKAILYGDQLYDPQAIYNSPDKQLILSDDETRKLFILDRRLISQDWDRAPIPKKTQTHRITFFGIKGGMGRSTALTIWARQLARQGKNILAIDLDLESPGLSSILLPKERSPAYGIVDWFVEDAVNQADDLYGDMVASSPLSDALPGQIRIVPAFGTDTGDYLTKLSRSYLDLAKPEGMFYWATRVARMLEALEIKEQPDVVFLDSRAGLHDIAAVTVTRLEADAFLFTVDNQQTWKSYELLFQHWRHHPQLLAAFRDHLQIVAAMVPETNADAYLVSFRQNAYRLFENLYEEAAPGDIDAFNFNVDDETAPHFPLRINWQRALQEFDPVMRPSNVSEAAIQAAYGDFWQAADRWLAAEEI